MIPNSPDEVTPLPPLPVPARRALRAAGVTSLDPCALLTEAEVRMLHGMGPKAIETLRAALLARGQTFAEPETR